MLGRETDSCYLGFIVLEISYHDTGWKDAAAFLSISLAQWPRRRRQILEGNRKQ